MPVSQVSPEGRTFIAGFEGCSLVAYLCPAGVPTIGRGHTKGVRLGDVLPDVAAADALFVADLAEFSAGLEPLLAGTDTSQHQYDALESLAYNIGVPRFASSTVLKRHRAGDATGAATAFGLWCNILVDGRLQPSPGLVRRRSAESVVYLTADQAPHPLPTPVSAVPMPQAVGGPTGMLFVGLSGPAIMPLQTALGLRHFYAGKIDGDFGPATQAAVFAFQRAQHLPADGVAGPQTLRALELA